MTIPEAWRWTWQAPAERATLPAASLTWAAAEIMHAASVPGLDVALPVALAAGVTYDRIARRRGEKSTRHARQAAVSLAAVGGWTALAAQYGPLYGPRDALSLAYLAGTGAGYVMLRRHDKVREAREWRRAKAGWPGRAAGYNLNGSHLLDRELTWLGESLVVDVRGTGRKASSYTRGGDLAETIAEAEMLPESRVRVTGGGLGGRVRISIRYSDPWAHPLPHPVLEPVDGFDMPVPCSVRQPLTIGYDPETGTALRVSPWTEHGAQNFLVVAMRGGGKSALLSCLRERLTAAEDAVVWDVNVSATCAENRIWAPACGLTAIGEDERERALRILLCARYAIAWRSAQRQFSPDARHPLIVIMIDEIDELVRANDALSAAIKSELARVGSKGRRNGVSLVIAGQRGTASWIGGADVRTQFDRFLIGKVNRSSEVNNAIGELAALVPDMATYGEGQPGVWAEVAPGVPPQLGRSFKLTEEGDLEDLADERAGWLTELEPGLVAHLGEHYASLREDRPMAHGPSAGGTDGPARQAAAPAHVPSWAGADEPSAHAPSGPGTTLDMSLEKLDREMSDALPQHLRDQLADLDARNAETRRLAAEADQIDAAMPAADPARIAAAAQARWDQGAVETGPLPAEIRDQLIAMLTGGGASGRSIAKAFEPDITTWTVQTWLNRLRYEQAARVVGRGRGARWMITAEADAAERAPLSGEHGE